MTKRKSKILRVSQIGDSTVQIIQSYRMICKSYNISTLSNSYKRTQISLTKINLKIFSNPLRFRLDSFLASTGSILEALLAPC